MKAVRVGLIVGVVIALMTGCSGGGPSDRQASEALARMYSEMSGVEVTEIRRFNKSGCRSSSGRDGVNCDVSGTLIMDAGRGRTTDLPVQANFRFYKHGGRWTAAAY